MYAPFSRSCFWAFEWYIEFNFKVLCSFSQTFKNLVILCCFLAFEAYTIRNHTCSKMVCKLARSSEKKVHCVNESCFHASCVFGFWISNRWDIVCRKMQFPDVDGKKKINRLSQKVCRRAMRKKKPACASQCKTSLNWFFCCA